MKTAVRRSGFCNLSWSLDTAEGRASHDRCTLDPCDCECHVAAPKVLVTEHAELVPVEYRSPEWYAARQGCIAASEIAAVLGISPWVSPFDLWWLKRTGEDSQTENPSMRRGRRYEALILEDFAEEHPEFYVYPSVTVRSVQRPWQLATPDGLAFEGRVSDDLGLLMRGDVEPVAVIEAKTGQRWEWGEPGTDDIPVHYRAQVLWQMDVLGLNVAYLPVLFGDRYEEYVVEYHEADVAFMRSKAEDFLASLRECREPDIDDSHATARRLKRMHAEIDPGEVEVAPHVIAQYRAAKRLRDAAEARMRLNENRIRHALGARNVATVDGRKVASRSVYDVKERTQTVRAHTVNRLTFSKPTRERNPS